MELTYNENVDTHDMKNGAGSTCGYTVPRGIYEISGLNLILKFLFPNKIKVNITDDDVRLR